MQEKSSRVQSAVSGVIVSGILWIFLDLTFSCVFIRPEEKESVGVIVSGFLWIFLDLTFSCVFIRPEEKDSVS